MMNGSPTWRTYTGKWVTIHALEGSYAVRRAHAALRDAERAIELLERSLEPAADRRGAPVDIYLTDPVAALPAGAAAAAHDDDGGGTRVEAMGERAIVCVVQPESPGGLLIWHLTRLLVVRWFGAGAASAALFLTGVAGWVAARIGAGPAEREADDWVRAELAAGGAVSIFSRPSPVRPSDLSSPHLAPGSLAATSFVAFLIETFGAAALRQFLIDLRSRPTQPGSADCLSAAAGRAGGVLAGSPAPPGQQDSPSFLPLPGRFRCSAGWAAKRSPRWRIAL